MLRPMYNNGECVVTTLGKVIVTDVELIYHCLLNETGEVVELHERDIVGPFKKNSPSRSSWNLRKLIDEMYEVEVELSILRTRSEELRAKLRDLTAPGDVVKDDRLSIVHVRGARRRIYTDWYKSRVKVLGKLADVKHEYEEIEGESYIAIKLI